METCQRDCDQPVTHFYLAATHSSGNPIYNISLTRTAPAALVFLSRAESDYTAVPTQANECQSPGTGVGMSSVWHRLASVGADL